MTEINPKTFNVLELAQGSNFPTDEITVYLDQDSALRFSRLQEKQSRTRDDEEINKIEKELDDLRDKVYQSKLIFHLQGIPRTELQKLSEKYEDPVEAARAILAAHIIKIENAEGEVDEREFTLEHIQTLYSRLPGESIDRLETAVTELTIRAAYFENVETSADF